MESWFRDPERQLPTVWGNRDPELLPRTDRPCEVLVIDLASGTASTTALTTLVLKTAFVAGLIDDESKLLINFSSWSHCANIGLASITNPVGASFV